jgi:hypothetical protein
MTLFDKHPQVDKIYFEKDIINVAPTKEWLEKYVRDRFTQSWGDKLPWYAQDADYMISSCYKWIKYFRPNARIIHIIRHPIDVALSNTLRDTNPKRVKKQLDKYTATVPQIINFINPRKMCVNVLFEDLVYHTEEILGRLYSFCDLDNDKKIIKEVMQKPIGGIKIEKAFAYRKMGVDFDIPHFTYEEINATARLI